MIDRIKIRIKVKNANYFIKDLVYRKIKLYGIEQNKEYIELVIDKEDYEKLEEMKTIKKLEIINDYGKSKLKRRIKKYYSFIIVVLIGILLNIFLSTRILSIEIDTPNQELKQILQKDLEKFGIKKYNKKISYKEKEKLKEELKKIEKDKIEWLEIEEIGTKIIIKVEEKKLEKKKEECLIRNVIAKKNAMITKIESTDGEIVKKKQDYVEKGEVIISGFIHNKEEIVSTKCANGRVLGETWYKVIVEVPIYKEVREKTSNHKKVLSITFLNKEYTFPKKYKEYTQKEYDIINSKIYPFKVQILSLQEVKRKQIKYTLKTVEEVAIKNASLKLEEALSIKPTIIRKKVLKKTIKNSKIIVEVFFALEEDITEYQNVENNNM